MKRNSLKSSLLCTALLGSVLMAGITTNAFEEDKDYSAQNTQSVIIDPVISEHVYGDTNFEIDYMNTEVDSSTSKSNKLESSSDSVYLKPLLDTIVFTDVTEDSANLSFMYETESIKNSKATTEFFYTNPIDGVHLLEDDGDELEMEMLSDAVVGSEHILTYKINDLDSNEEYDDLTLFIDAYADADLTTPISTLESPDSTFTYNTLNIKDGFTTDHDLTYYLVIIIMLIIILALVAIAVFIVFSVWWWHRHISMAIYIDSTESFASGEIVLDLIHVHKYPDLLNCHEEELKLYAEGREIDAIFRRNPKMEDGYKIYLTEDAKDNKLPFLSLMEAQKYNGFYIGIGGKEYHAQYIPDKKAREIARSHYVKAKNLIGYNREKILNEMNDEFRKQIAQEATHGMLGHISPNKSRSHSLRYQILFPSVHKVDEHLVGEGENIGVYYVYKGKLYELDLKFIGVFGSMVEFDIINLEPGMIYPGLSVSFDNGKTILPSSAIYGITRDEDHQRLSKTDAQLAKPKEGAKAYPLWTEEDAIAYVGKVVVESIKDVLTKKHYEEQTDELILRIDEAHQHHDDYVDVWFKEARETKESNINIDNNETK